VRWQQKQSRRDCGLSTEPHPIDTDLPRNVLERLLAYIFKGHVELSASVLVHTPGNANATRISKTLQSSRHMKTRHRIRYLKVDADTGEEVPNEDIIKGYQVDKDGYLEVTKDELNIALESTRTIEIDEFVPRTEIDDLYLVRPYYIVPDGKAGHDAYAVIRETIRSLDQVAIGRVVLTNREHVIALEAREKGLMGMLLRYPYEVRDAAEYFDGIQDVKVTKDMLDLAKHIVETKAGHFEPAKFQDHYESALQELLEKKQKGQPITTAKKAPPSNVYNLMDALRASIKGGQRTPAEKPAKAAKKSKSAKPAAKRKAS
jgi:DNA end-binding protein Ku